MEIHCRSGATHIEIEYHCYKAVPAAVNFVVREKDETMMIPGISRRTSALWATALLTFAMLLALAACSNEATPTPTPGQTTTVPQPTSTPEPTLLSVVTTTSIVADWVENIGGDSVEVFSIVPRGVDPHGFQPGARDVARIAEADLVLTVGLGLEESWLRELLQNAARDPATIVELADAIEPIEFGETHIEDVEFLEELSHAVHEVEEGEISAEEGLEEIAELLEGMEGVEHEGEEAEEPLDMVNEILEQFQSGQIDAEEAIEEIEHITGEGEEEHEGHGHGVHDPHFWFDPLRVKLVTNDIAARLSTLDSQMSDAYSDNASAYGARLDELHSWTGEQVAMVPEERRLLVTSHDSLGYFAEQYGFTVVGVVLGSTTEAEPSAESLAELTHEVEELGVPAIFGETTVSERLANTVASESGARLVRLYSGSLDSQGTDAGTYVDMVRTNVERIVEALS